jgi:hemoglobin-like flavoprotein
MNLHAVALARDSLEKVLPDGDATIALFYARLLALDPTLRPLLPPDEAAHGRYLLAFLRQYLAGLSTPQTFIPAVKQLGRLHSQHGIQAGHYHTFCQAFLWVMARQLGDEFTPETAVAWTDAFCLLIGLMKEAAAQAPESDVPPLCLARPIGGVWQLRLD